MSHPHLHEAFGYLVDTPAVRTVVEEARRLMALPLPNADRVDALKPAFEGLLSTDGWLPEAMATPDEASGMGGGIGQYALYRAEDGSLCLFSLVVPAGAMTPVHDHLAWGLVGIYRGTQDETVYRRLDDGSDPAQAQLEVAVRQTLGRGECYALLPPDGDIHYVKTVSETPSVSIHLLANDTACVWRHRFDPQTGRVTPFRSGYSNATCPPEDGAGASE
ncbi:MAG TPA: cysteine dioxygenase family protein [Vicinamibacterales bacterium]|nr:cysteine dioxygenase family protein [Vicinamibacterales bacterium]